MEIFSAAHNLLEVNRLGFVCSSILILVLTISCVICLINLIKHDEEVRILVWFSGSGGSYPHHRSWWPQNSPLSPRSLGSISGWQVMGSRYGNSRTSVFFSKLGKECPQKEEGVLVNVESERLERYLHGTLLGWQRRLWSYM